MNLQNGERLTMDRRPGMQIKYLPYRYDETSGNLYTGGAYLFDTLENAKDYARWAKEEFQVGDPKVPFFEQFLGHRAWVCEVLGACNFAPVEDCAVDDTQLWNYSSAKDDVEQMLRAAFSKLKAAAQTAGATSIWLLQNSKEKTVGFHLTFPKAGAGGGLDAVRESLVSAKRQKSLEHLLPKDLGLTPLYTRSSPILTSWLPRSRAAGGVEFRVPFSDLLSEKAVNGKH
jgi:hypothetical protein